MLVIILHIVCLDPREKVGNCKADRHAVDKFEVGDICSGIRVG